MRNNRKIGYSPRYSIETIRKEASSMTIHKTIAMVEEASGVKFPRGGTPSESRQIMVDIIANRLR